MERTLRSPRTGTVALLSLATVLVLVVVACSGGNGTPTPTPSPAPTATPTAAPSATPTPAPPTPAPPTAPATNGSAAASLVPSSSQEVTGAKVCADLAAFQADLATLTGLDLKTAKLADVLGAVGSAISSGQAFAASAQAAFGPEAQALGTALTGLQSALQGITAEGTLGDKAATIENAIDDVAAAFDALKADVAPGCPTPTPSGG